MTQEEKAARLEARRKANQELKLQTQAMAERINSRPKEPPVDSSGRRYIAWVGWSKVPRTGARYRRQGC